MSVKLKIIGGAVAVFALQAAAANAQLLTEKRISSGMALTIAQTAIETCKANGYSVSVTIVGRLSEVLLQVRGDTAGNHTMENSFRKAYTARTFRTTSGEFASRMLKPGEPPGAATNLTNIIAAAGALPIKAGEDFVGAVGVSGAPGGDKDEVCTRAGIAKIQDRVK